MIITRKPQVVREVLEKLPSKITRKICVGHCDGHFFSVLKSAIRVLTLGEIWWEEEVILVTAATAP